MTLDRTPAMSSEENYHDFSRYQAVLRQSSILQCYTHLLNTFPLDHDSLRDEVAAKLEHAITEIQTAIPWLGAKVVNEGKTARNSGLYHLVSCEPPEHALTVRDLSTRLPSYPDIKAMKAPMSVFESWQLSPVLSFPSRFDNAAEGPAHVVRV